MSSSRRSSRHSSLETISGSSSSAIIIDDSDVDDWEDIGDTFVDSKHGSQERPITLDIDEEDHDIDAYLDEDSDSEYPINGDEDYLFDNIFRDFDHHSDEDDRNEESEDHSAISGRPSSEGDSPLSKFQDHSSVARAQKRLKNAASSSRSIASQEQRGILPSSISPKRKRSESEDITSVSERWLPNDLRNLCIDLTIDSTQSYHVDDNVELRDHSFLRIKHVSQETQTVSGIFMKKLEKIGPSMSNRQNPGHELCWVVDLSEQDYIRGIRSELIEVPMSTIKRKRTIILTNLPLSQEDRSYSRRRFQDSNKIASLPTLYCRWKLIQVFKDTRKSKAVEAVYAHLKEESADEVHRSKDSVIRRRFQGGKISAGGSYVQHVDNPETVSLLEGDMATQTPCDHVHVHRQYTLGDGFCGAGGITCGAIKAGLHPLWGFDDDPHPLQSYAVNTEDKGTVCLHLSVEKFLQLASVTQPSNYKVDILHLSTPCQYFSPCHTIPGSNDEHNEAALFCIGRFLEVLRPRVVTMEQTPGLYQRHRTHFRSVINDFTTAGYSVRHRIVNSEQYGVPAERRRLIIIASAPGEALPEFPPPTHGPGTGRPFNYIKNAIDRIPWNATLHDKNRSHFSTRRTPFSPLSLAKTMTCGGFQGAGNYHPSGYRQYTVREFGCLQGFPSDWEFVNSEGDVAGITMAKKQIGNAVPPILGRAIFRAIDKSLKKTDGLA